MLADIIQAITPIAAAAELDMEEYRKVQALVRDPAYLQLLQQTQGGYAFGQSLQFYSLGVEVLDCNIFYNNFLFKKYYQDLVEVVLVIGEDLFGNQYAFLSNGSLVLIDIQSADLITTMDDFNAFCKVLAPEPDYYSGFSIEEAWEEQHDTLQAGMRLCPIKPFVIGGAYEISNFIALEKEKLFDYCSYIARKIKDLPDGTKVQLMTPDTFDFKTES